MMGFPSTPGWDGIHPAMVHFPIALLLAAPLLLLASLFARQTWRTWAVAALTLMALGAVATWFVVGSGHAAGQLVDKTPALERLIQRHEALGVTTRNLFTLLTVLFGVILLLPAMTRKAWPAWLRIGIHAVFLVLYVGATTVLTNAANQGGRLVHGTGVRALVEPVELQASAVPSEEGQAARTPAPARPPAGTTGGSAAR